MKWNLLQLITLILIAASVPKKVGLEDAKPAPESVRTTECSKSLSLEPGTQLEEKKTSESSLDSQHASELQKRLDPEKVVDKGQEAGQLESSALPESPRARAEVGFLQEMVRWTLVPKGSWYSLT